MQCENDDPRQVTLAIPATLGWKRRALHAPFHSKSLETHIPSVTKQSFFYLCLTILTVSALQLRHCKY